ncbi:hypothetical protein GN956_G12424 [Arapaima gigas]
MFIRIIGDLGLWSVDDPAALGSWCPAECRALVSGWSLGSGVTRCGQKTHGRGPVKSPEVQAPPPPNSRAHTHPSLSAVRVREAAQSFRLPSCPKAVFLYGAAMFPLQKERRALMCVAQACRRWGWDRAPLVPGSSHASVQPPEFERVTDRSRTNRKLMCSEVKGHDTVMSADPLILHCPPE